MVGRSHIIRSGVEEFRVVNRNTFLKKGDEEPRRTKHTIHTENLGHETDRREFEPVC